MHRVDPTSAEQKHEQAKAERGIWCRPLPDGMAGIYSVHDAVTAQAIYTRIAALAGKAAAVAGPEDNRCADARRADTLADLVLDYTSAPSSLDSMAANRPCTCSCPSTSR